MEYTNLRITVSVRNSSNHLYVHDDGDFYTPGVQFGTYQSIAKLINRINLDEERLPKIRALAYTYENSLGIHYERSLDTSFYFNDTVGEFYKNYFRVTSRLNHKFHSFCDMLERENADEHMLMYSSDKLMDTKMFTYPGTCGAFIISPSMYHIEFFLNSIGVSKITSKLLEYRKYKDLDKLFCNLSMLFMCNSMAGDRDNRAMVFITDSYQEDYTSDYLEDKNVFFKIENEKTDNMLRARVFGRDELIEILKEQIKSEISENETLWNQLKLELIELAQTQKYFLKEITDMCQQENSSMGLKEILLESRRVNQSRWTTF